MPDMSTQRAIKLAVGLAAAGTVLLWDGPLHHVAGMGDRPARAAAVALLMALWWLLDALPMAWVACIPLVAWPLLQPFDGGVLANAAAGTTPYLDAYIFLFLGGMVLGAAMENTGLHKRVALHIMVRVGTRPPQLLAGVLLATCVVSLWLSNTATAVMMLPIATALVKRLEKDAPGGALPRYGCSVMLAVAYGANLGGMGTKIGTGTNSILVGHLARTLQRDVGFLEFMFLAVPFMVLFLPLAWAALWHHGRADAPSGAAARHVLTAELAALGPLAGPERRVAACFTGAALFWMAGDLIKPVVGPLVPAPWEGWHMAGKHYEAAVALTAGAAAMVMRTVTRRALARVPWGTLLLLGGSFSMAEGLAGSGLSAWLSGELATMAQLPDLLRYLVGSTASVFLSAVASNTATINVMLAVLPGQVALLFTAALAASCDFMLPAGTPPNAMVFGSGYVKLPVMMRVGFALDLAAAGLLALYGTWWLQGWLGA